MDLELPDLLDDVIEDECDEDDLAGHDEEVGGRDVAEQFDGSEIRVRQDAAGRGEFEGDSEIRFWV